MMYGLIQPSAGEMRWMGQKVVLAGPSEARALGIGMVFQHFSLFDNLTVAENVALGLPPTESFAAISERLEETARVYGLPLDPKREVWRLSVGERQRIEIVRALMQNPKLLILDEPTSVLTPQEADQLFVVLERLKSEGRAILYISHKLEEVKRLCDTATILRGGKKVATCDPRQETAASLARMMVGAEIGEVKAASGRGASVPRLVIHKLSLEPDDPHGTRLARGVARGARRRDRRHRRRRRQRPGRIVCGAVRRAPVAAAKAPSSSTARRPACSASPSAAAWARPSCPEERLGHGAAPRMKLSENALLTGHAASGMVKRGFIDKPATLAHRRPHHQDLRRAQGQARSGGGEPLRRQSAEIRRRPRNPARARRAGRQPADLGRRCRRGGDDPSGADRSCRRAAPRCW